MKPWLAALIAIMTLAISILVSVALSERRKRERRRQKRQQDLALLVGYKGRRTPSVAKHPSLLQKPSPLAAPRIARPGAADVQYPGTAGLLGGALWSDLHHTGEEASRSDVSEPRSSPSWGGDSSSSGGDWGSSPSSSD